MKHAFYKNRWLWSIFAVLALAACLLQTIAVLTAYNADANYFDKSSPLPIFALFCAVIAAVIATIAALRTDPAPAAATPFWRSAIPSPTGIGFLVTAIAIALSKHTMTNTWTRPLAALFLLVAAVYSVFVQIERFRKSRTPAVLSGFGAILACILINAYYYFDVSVEMNAPLKTSAQTAILFLLLYLTAELRYLFGDPQQRVYLILSSWTVAFGALIAIPLPIAYLTGRFDRPDYAASGVLALCAIVMIAFRVRTLFDLRHQIQEKEEKSRLEEESLPPLWVNPDAAEENVSSIPVPPTDDDPDDPSAKNDSDRKDQP